MTQHTRTNIMVQRIKKYDQYLIQNHNANLPSTAPARWCSCHQKSECPINNECLSESVIYKAAVLQSPSEISEYYCGNWEKTFKERYNHYTATFRSKSQQKSTELSEHISELKWSIIKYQISWDLASRPRHYNGCWWKCELTIAKVDLSSLLNCRDEFISKSRCLNNFT